MNTFVASSGHNGSLSLSATVSVNGQPHTSVESPRFVSYKSDVNVGGKLVPVKLSIDETSLVVAIGNDIHHVPCERREVVGSVCSIVNGKKVEVKLDRFNPTHTVISGNGISLLED